MRLNTSFALEFSLFNTPVAPGYDCGGGYMPDDAFISKMGSILDKQITQKSEENKVKLHDDKIMMQKGPENWRLLTAEMEETIRALNKGRNLITYQHDEHHATISIGKRQITVSLDPINASIKYEGVA